VLSSGAALPEEYVPTRFRQSFFHIEQFVEGFDRLGKKARLDPFGRCSPSFLPPSPDRRLLYELSRFHSCRELLVAKGARRAERREVEITENFPFMLRLLCGCQVAEQTSALMICFCSSLFP
jgi:hypothetical protein